jgi:hypothetical protein
VRPTHPRLAALCSTALALALLLAACGGGSPQGGFAPISGSLELGDGAAAAPTFAPAEPAPAPTGPPATAAPAEAGGAAPAITDAQTAPVLNDPSRKIIKDAQIAMEVANIDLALSRINGIAAQVGGYILESNTDYTIIEQKRAIVRLGVPVDKFEITLQSLREGADKVLSEQASGVDVTQEFVDVQSQIGNLEATQARIREFLAQAKTVEEALKVNAQLTEIEAQLSQLKGRLQFLSQRAAFSTITVQLQMPPPPTPTPMPTLTPMPTPTPVPIWNPT